MAELVEILSDLVGIRAIPQASQESQRRQGSRAIERSRNRRRMRLLRRCFENQQRRQNESTLFFAVILSGLFSAVYSPISVWRRQRSCQWWEIDVLTQFTDRQWYENFRMTRAAFQLLCNQLQQHIMRQDTNMRQPVSTVKLVALTLYRLATGESFRTISNLFGVGRTTACDGFWDVCNAICTFLKPIYVKRPKGESVNRMIRIFEAKYGFPMCGGAIDGTHIPIIAPDQYHTDYFNRKGWYSVILQGLVDHEFKFIDFDVGQPGKCHDAWVFESSKLFFKLKNGTFYPKLTRQIDDQDVPIVILGDSAYGLTEFLMKPYAEAIATPEQLRFNVRLSGARILVEHAFGRLKGRWRCIMKRNDSHAKNVHILVSACIVLHNFCETWKLDNGDLEQDKPEDADQPDERVNNEEEIAATATGEQIRNALTRHFLNN